MKKGERMTDEVKRKIREAQKGEKGYWWGKKNTEHSKRMKNKISWNKGKKTGSIPWNKGERHSKETIEKIKVARSKQVITQEHKKKISEGNKGKIRTELQRVKYRESKLGERNPQWIGGIPKKYPNIFNRMLREKIRRRDAFTCCLCKKTEREELEEFNRVLAVNHIDFKKSNCNENNLNTLCLRCNSKINNNREYWKQYFMKQNDNKTTNN